MTPKGENLPYAVTVTETFPTPFDDAPCVVADSVLFRLDDVVGTEQVTAGHLLGDRRAHGDRGRPAAEPLKVARLRFGWTQAAATVRAPDHSGRVAEIRCSSFELASVDRRASTSFRRTRGLTDSFRCGVRRRRMVAGGLGTRLLFGFSDRRPQSFGGDVE